MGLTNDALQRLAFGIVSGSVLPSKAWTQLIHLCRANGLKGRRIVAVAFYGISMKLDEHKRKLLLRVDRMVKELERLDSLIDPKDITVVILNGLSSHYGAGVRMLENPSDWPTREWII